MKKVLLMALCTGFLFTIVGCETLKGVGKDIENTGNNIQELLAGEK